MEQNMILLHFYRTLKVFMLNKWGIGIDGEASHIQEAKKNLDYYKDKNLEVLVLKELRM